MHGIAPQGMKIRSQSQSYFRGLLPIGAVAVLIAGCSDRKPRTTDATPEPRATPAPSASSGFEPAREAVLLRATATPQPESPEIDKASDPAALAKEYRATADVDKRGELVEALWSLDTPAAVNTLRQLFLTEPEVDVKVDILAGLADSKKAETREGRFGLVVTALAPGQPKDIRELAAQMLVDFDDPRAVGLLQQYTQDADPDMREAAKEALETRRAVEQP
jgi:hypothetical protein